MGIAHLMNGSMPIERLGLGGRGYRHDRGEGWGTTSEVDLIAEVALTDTISRYQHLQCLCECLACDLRPCLIFGLLALAHA